MTKHPRAQQTSNPVNPTSEDADARQRIVRDRDAAIETLRRLGVVPTEHTGGAGSDTLDEGDQAQASERQDMGVAYRERLADRINRLTRALELLTRGTYGVCEVCRDPIGAERLAAIPEVTTCRKCQERVERDAA